MSEDDIFAGAAGLSDKWFDWSVVIGAGGEALFHNGRVLEVGPGCGVDALMLCRQACEYVMLDMDAWAVVRFRALIGAIPRFVRFVRGDCRAMPFLPSRFDVVVDFSTFDNTDNPFLAYSEAARVLRDGGLLLTTYANSRVLGTWNYPGETWIDPDQLVGHLEAIHMEPFWSSETVMVDRQTRTFGQDLKGARAGLAARKFGPKGARKP